MIKCILITFFIKPSDQDLGQLNGRDFIRQKILKYINDTSLIKTVENSELLNNNQYLSKFEYRVDYNLKISVIN